MMVWGGGGKWKSIDYKIKKKHYWQYAAVNFRQVNKLIFFSFKKKSYNYDYDNDYGFSSTINGNN